MDISRKRRRGAQLGPRQRKYPRTAGPRAGYQTVARTRGVYQKGEMKYFDSLKSAVAIPESTNWTGTEIDPTTLNTLFCPTEGAAINQRIGRKVHIHKIKIRGVIDSSAESDQADIFSSPAIRLILYQDLQTNSTQAQGEEVMTQPSTATVPLAFASFQNVNNFGRFRVLKDVTFHPRDMTAGTDGASTTSQNSANIPFKMSINFKKPIVVTFNATNGGTIADIVDNSFHLIANKSSTPSAHTVSYQCRVCYKE